MTKKNLMPVIVLTAICIAVAALLAAVNALTKPIIDDRNNSAISESLGKVMEGGKFDSEPDELKDGAPKTISKVFTEKNGMGTVVVLVTNKGYTGKNIGITVGIGSDGKITGMEITQNEESIVPSELKPGGSYGEHYVGAGADDIPELETGATVKFTENAKKPCDEMAHPPYRQHEQDTDIHAARRQKKGRVRRESAKGPCKYHAKCRKSQKRKHGDRKPPRTVVLVIQQKDQRECKAYAIQHVAHGTHAAAPYAPPPPSGQRHAAPQKRQGPFIQGQITLGGQMCAKQNTHGYKKLPHKPLRHAQHKRTEQKEQLPVGIDLHQPKKRARKPLGAGAESL